jgi:hypothetical protein
MIRKRIGGMRLSSNSNIDPTLDQMKVEQLHGNCWINFQMSLLGLKLNLNVASLQNILFYI